MDKQLKRPNERMFLVYRKVESRLYGYLEFYNWDSRILKSPIAPHRKSNPFVIGRYSSSGTGELRVYGSLPFLLEEIRRMITELIDCNNSWYTERVRLRDETQISNLDLGYDQKAMDLVILISIHTRNLLDLIKRFGGKSIPRLNYNNSRDGHVKLRELFDTLIHNRYYYFDGGHIRDFFSEKFKNNSALSGRFMGYGFDLCDFLKGISEVIEEVRVKDFTQLIRREFNRFTANSEPKDVIFLVQNVHALSEVLKTKSPKKGYEFMNNLMAGELADAAVMEPPRIKIAPDLSKKEFEIRFRWAMGAQNQQLARNDLKDHKLNSRFDDFLPKVNDAFGVDRLLFGTPRRFVSRSVDKDQ